MPRKKEVTEVEVEEVKLDSGKQKALKTISKIVAIFATIGRVCLYIAIPFIVLAMVVSPMVMKDIYVDRTGFAYKEHKIDLIETDNGLELKYKDSKLASFDIKEREALFEMLDKFSANKLIAIVEISLLVSLAIVIVAAMVLKAVSKLGNNINEKETPFLMENVKLVRKIAYFEIALFFISLIGSAAISALTTGVSSLSYDIPSIFYILIIFMASYILEYGCVLQQNSKETIYTV